MTDTMSEILGDFKEDLHKSNEFLCLSFSPGSIPLQQRWRNNGLSADFVADYLVTFFPAREDDPQTIQRQKELKSAVSYIANELLENAMKFHSKQTDDPIQFGLYLQEDNVVIFSINSSDQDTVDQLRQVIDKLTTYDLEELYINQMEQMAEENGDTSGLGLLTIIHDYLAKVGWKFETLPSHPGLIMVTTMVQLTV